MLIAIKWKQWLSLRCMSNWTLWYNLCVYATFVILIKNIDLYYTCTIFLSTQEWFNVWNILYYPVFKNIFKRKKKDTKSIDQCQHWFSVCASVRERVYACVCTGLLAFASCFVSSLYEVLTNYLFLAEIPVHTGTLHFPHRLLTLWSSLKS